MGEPTNDVIAHALATAKELLRRYPDYSLATAIAWATTTEQCRGYNGFQVYAAVRKLIAESEGLSATAAAGFTEKAQDKRALDALDNAVKKVNV